MEKLSIFDLIIFISMLIITIINLIFSSLIRYWRANDLIQNKKPIGIIFTIISLILTILLLIACFIENFIFYHSYNKKNYPCIEYNYENTNNNYYNYLYHSKKLNLQIFNESKGRLAHICDNYKKYDFVQVVKIGEIIISYITISFF